MIDSNNDWQTGPNAAEIQTLGFAPEICVEPAVIRTFSGGAYTAIISGEGDTPTGVATIEAYQSRLMPRSGDVSLERSRPAEHP